MNRNVLITPSVDNMCGLSWYSWRDEMPTIGKAILCGNTGPKVDGMHAVYLGYDPVSRKHLVRMDAEYWVDGARLGQRYQ